jgi:hypothetical protein
MSKQTQPPPLPLSKQDRSGACRRCANRKVCKAPCFFAEMHLSHDNRKPFEKDIDDFTVVYPRVRRELRESELPDFENGTPTGPKQIAFSDATENPFPESFTPKLKQTGIFIDRFFFHKTYAELAEKYNTTTGGVAKMYVNAKERLFKTVEAMDRVELAKNNGEPIISMTPAVRVFFLHVLFGLSNIEISRLLGLSHSLVHRYLTITRDRLICGEVDFISFSDDDRQAALARLETMRSKRRAYDMGRTPGHRNRRRVAKRSE